jgi:hypothetical protein
MAASRQTNVGECVHGSSTRRLDFSLHAIVGRADTRDVEGGLEAREKLLATVVRICGLPPIRGAAIVRRALWQVGVNASHAEPADYLEAVFAIKSVLGHYHSESNLKERLDALQSFLATGKVQHTPSDMDGLLRKLREANDRLEQSQKLDLPDDFGEDAKG